MSKTLEQVVLKRDQFLARLDAQRPKPSKPDLKRADATSDFVICARMRPLNSKEKNKQYFNVVKHTDTKLCLNDPGFKYDGSLQLKKNIFELDRVFGVNVNTDHIYQDVGVDLVSKALMGGISTCCHFGQTGSGKTFTAMGLRDNIAKDLFARQAGLNINDNEREVYLACFEITGKKSFDLLGNNADGNKQEVKIRETLLLDIETAGLSEHKVTSHQQIQELTEQALANRRTTATFRNEASSRSHAVLQFRIVNSKIAQAEDGFLRVIDLAGSETQADKKHHTKEIMQDTQAIHTSLLTLKQCFRSRILSVLHAGKKHVHLPFRDSPLTLLLKNAFALDQPKAAHTVIIATIAPSCMDVAASKNTLGYVSQLRIPIPKEFLSQAKANSPKSPATWDHAYTQKWIARHSKKQIDPKILAPTETGAQLCRVPEGEFMRRVMACPGNGMRSIYAKKFYDDLWELLILARCSSRAENSSKKKTLMARKNQPNSRISNLSKPKRINKPKPKTKPAVKTTTKSK